MRRVVLLAEKLANCDAHTNVATLPLVSLVCPPWSDSGQGRFNVKTPEKQGTLSLTQLVVLVLVMVVEKARSITAGVEME